MCDSTIFSGSAHQSEVGAGGSLRARKGGARGWGIWTDRRASIGREAEASEVVPGEGAELWHSWRTPGSPCSLRPRGLLRKAFFLPALTLTWFHPSAPSVNRPCALSPQPRDDSYLSFHLSMSTGQAGLLSWPFSCCEEPRSFFLSAWCPCSACRNFTVLWDC